MSKFIRGTKIPLVDEPSQAETELLERIDKIQERIEKLHRRYPSNGMFQESTGIGAVLSKATGAKVPTYKWSKMYRYPDNGRNLDLSLEFDHALLDVIDRFLDKIEYGK